VAFEIDEGVVKVTAEVERSSLAKAARSAGEDAGVEVEKGVRSGFGRSSDANKEKSIGFIRKMFTPSTGAFDALRAPFAAALSTPIGGAAIAVAAVFAATFAAAAVTAVAGLGLGALFLGLGAMALKEVKPVVKAFEGLKKTITDVGRQAAKPLIRPFVEALTGTSDLVRELKGEFRDIFKALAPVVPLLTKAFGFFSGEVIRGIRDSMPGIVAAFEGFARVLPEVGKWIGDFFRTIFENEDVIDNTTAAVTKMVFGPLKLLGPLISGLTVLFGAFNNIMIMSQEGWGMITKAMLDFFDGGTGAVGRFKEAWGPVSDAIQVVWDKLVAFAGEDNKEMLTTRFTELIQAIKDAWAPIKNLIGVAWDEAWAFVKRIWNDKVEPWINDTLIPWLREKLVALMEGAWDAAKAKARQKIDELIKAVIGILFGLPALIWNTLSPIPGRVLKAFSDAAASARSGASRVVSGAIDFIRTLPGKVGAEMGKIKGRVTGAFSGAGSWLYGAGRAIMSGLLNGIKSAWESVAGYLSSLGGKIKDLKGPLEKDRVLLVPEGQAIMGGLVHGLQSEIGSLESTLAGMTGMVVRYGEISRDAWNQLLAAGWRGNPNDNMEALYQPSDVVIHGQVPDSVWNQLLAAGWKGDPNDGMEALYRPAMSLRPSSPSSPSSSTGSMSPSFNVKVYVGDREIKDLVRVEINEHDRSLDRQVSSGAGGFRL
jgi:hypothetical protein